jgi:uncharacterized membrane protein
MSGWFIVAHAIGAALALGIGGWQLIHVPKGDRAHRLVGRIWVVLMYWTVLSSFFIHSLHPGHFSWLHGLSVFTFCTLTIGVWSAVRCNLARHRGFMRGSYIGLAGAFIGAVAVPNRDIPQLVVHQPATFAALAAAIAGAVASIIALCTAGSRQKTQTDAPATSAHAPSKHAT